MAKFEITGTVELKVEGIIEATDQEDATNKAESMINSFTPGCGLDVINQEQGEVWDVNEVD